MAFKNIREEGNYRTEDSERGIVLRKKFGPTPNGAYEFELDIAGEVITLRGISRTKLNQHRIFGVTKGMYDVDWYLDILYVPKAYDDQKNKIADIITEALKIWGDSYDEEIANSVSVTFSPELLA